MTGIAIAACGEEGRPLLDFFTSVSVVMMRVTTWIIYLAPVGVCFLIAGQIIIVSCIVACKRIDTLQSQSVIITA